MSVENVAEAASRGAGGFHTDKQMLRTVECMGLSLCWPLFVPRIDLFLFLFTGRTEWTSFWQAHPTFMGAFSGAGFLPAMGLFWILSTTRLAHDCVAVELTAQGIIRYTLPFRYVLNWERIRRLEVTRYRDGPVAHIDVRVGAWRRHRLWAFERMDALLDEIRTHLPADTIVTEKRGILRSRGQWTRGSRWFLFSVALWLMLCMAA
ncbi:MAG TPA: hypothetical protein PLO37_16325 [Candidatus Hydrogenedentes bacterium]|nr:hypothetical protein [Candidatus Hydrogenedentota bacterium]HPG68413.1 hypothetical protein [Candidatus Hydrogenedentota bacterium]